jgi:hypothetical protein
MLVFFAFISFALVCWCDLALAIEAWQARNTEPRDHWDVSKAGNWAVWAISGCLNLWIFWLLWDRIQRAGVVPWMFALALLWFDISLVTNETKRIRDGASRQ